MKRRSRRAQNPGSPREMLDVMNTLASRQGQVAYLTGCAVCVQEGVSNNTKVCAVDHDGNSHHRIRHTGGEASSRKHSICAETAEP